MQISRKFYGSNLLIHPDGSPMFRCSDSRLRWYAKRGLVKQVADKEFQFLFSPRGKGHSGDPYFLEVRENKCVTCGSESRLTKHHVIPHCFRRWCPESIKSHDHHDVLLLCQKCHQKYETEALRLKQDLANKYNDPLSKVVNDNDAMRIRKWAYAVQNYGEKIPSARRQEMLDKITEYIGHSPTPEDIEELCDIDCQAGGGPFGERIIRAQGDNLFPFVRMWREHFILRMQPKYLSKNWNINKPLNFEREVG